MYLLELARDATQRLVNEIWGLPVTRTVEGIFAALPAGSTVLPRQRPAPKEKVATRWERYAKMKGIANKKRERMVWDEVARAWKPRWGYKRGHDPAAVPWLEVPDGADPYEDQFAKLADEKKQRVEKNKAKRLRNLARATLTDAAAASLRGRSQRKKQLAATLRASQTATGSHGVFDERARKVQSGRIPLLHRSCLTAS